MKGRTNAKSELFRGEETLNISLTLDGTESSALIGATILITDTTSGETTELIYAGKALTTAIPAKHRYIVKANKLSGYAPPVKLSMWPKRIRCVLSRWII